MIVSTDDFRKVTDPMIVSTGNFGKVNDPMIVCAENFEKGVHKSGYCGGLKYPLAISHYSCWKGVRKVAN